MVTRRDLLGLGGFWVTDLALSTPGQNSSKTNTGFRPLFDGVSLRGWKREPRSLAQPSLGKWTVQDGAIIGGQETPGIGSYLVTEETFANFELQIEARPDWPADTGILVRTNAQGNIGFQVLLDYRPHGGIGGYYGNGLGNFIAYNYGFTAEKDKEGHVVRLIPEKPIVRPNTHPVPLDFCAPAEVFLRIWKLNGWNQFRIRSVGELPHLTTWINGEKITELNTSKIQAPGWDAKKVLNRIGRAGHIALEIHSNGPHDWLGKERWWPGNVCRWRNISIKTLPA
ncbi:MAG TPA: DUF1080 domain-containing protein [Bryobacteraceae bacterium]|nr:DUF1080 domain-containing protein [Bryobacteraceae bacterium]